MPLPFGKFTLLRKLGAGGMGEIFLALRQGPGPAAADGKLVIKRLLPHLSESARFLRLFLDEARVAAQLVHPNIVRIYELAEHEGAWFVAMEYVPGRDLRELNRLARMSKKPMPVVAACQIAADVARALDYAHRATDAAGRPLRIVHRDVSPHNILVSVTGVAKLCDFGVAKAANRATQTVTGVLKGKVPYMAPEQAEGKKVDRRADVFALGTCLWEMLANRFLFRAKSDALMIRLVREGDIPPPSRHNPKVPKVLDELVMGALTRSLRERCQWAGELADGLDELLRTQLPGGRDAVSTYLRQMFPVPAEESDNLEDVTIEESRQEEESTVPTRARPRATKPPALPGERTARRATGGTELGDITERPTNLPRHRTSFVGRVAELAELGQLLQKEARVISLVGPPGFGKSRLATQVATLQLGVFAHGGVWHVDAQDAADVEALCLAVAEAVGILLPTETGGVDAVHFLGRALAARGKLLIVLDDVGIAAGPAAVVLRRWVELAPRAFFLVASREPLALQPEKVFSVGPLRTTDDPDTGGKSEASHLLAARVEIARASPKQRGEERLLAELGQRLCGVPLALELVAARAAEFSVRQLAERFPPGTDTGTDPQSVLPAALEWTFGLLLPHERSLLAQCSVFRGGFSEESVEAVALLTGFSGAPSPGAVLDRLVARGLVRPSGSGATAPRFDLHEAVRSFARDKLEGSRNTVEVQERHSRHYLWLGAKLATAAEANPEALAKLSDERQNLYAVLQRGLAGARLEDRSFALRAALVLDPLLTARGPFGAHLSILDAALERAGAVDPTLHAVGHEARGKARQTRWKLAEAAADFERALGLAKEAHDARLVGRLLTSQGSVLRLMGRAEEAERLLLQALNLQRETGDRKMEGRTLGGVGMLLQDRGEVSDALRTYSDALEALRVAKDRRFEAVILSNMGALQQQQGLHGQAKLCFEAALEVQRSLSNRRAEGALLASLGDAFRDLGNESGAQTCYRRAAAIAREAGARRPEAAALVALATLGLEAGRLDVARRHVQHALALATETPDRRLEGLARATLGAAEALGGEVDQGAELVDQALALVSGAGDALLVEAIQLYRAHLEFAQSRLATAAGQLQAAQALRDRVHERIRHAEAASVPDAGRPGGGPSSADRSEHVRSALRSLRAAMTREERPVEPTGSPGHASR